MTTEQTAAAIERVREAMKLGLDALTAIQARMQKVPEVQGREFVSLGIQTVNAISALSSPQLVAEIDRLAAVPEGWSLTPLEPTVEMTRAAARWLANIHLMRAGDRTEAINDAYRAMVRAAPFLPQSATKEQTA